ncbi:hypothetical protein PVAG01_08553 [Phlyctema vagabunda]|uniref:Pre-mRNA-splicing factor 38B n=1 Tax=Phlyctema vagabunda TaxID=108571 RepID=A0ABR4P9Q7_9HELO
MANDEMFSDDYVAQLIAKDAKESTIKYSALGLEAFAPSKPPTNKPKPNTRFLRNIIKDTDSHNAALLAKEAAESRARLDSLSSNAHRAAKATRVGGGDIRRRQLGDIAAILGGRPGKRKRAEESKQPEVEPRRLRITSSADGEIERNSGNGRERGHNRQDEASEDEEESRSHRSRRRRHRSDSEDRERHADDRRRRHRSRTRSRSPREQRTDERRHRDRSPRRRRSKSREDVGGEKEKLSRSHQRAEKHKHSTSPSRTDSHRRSHGRSASLERYRPKRRSEKSAPPAKAEEPEAKSGHDSDPLDEIIGPRPAPVERVRTRGRGTISQASGIDSRFSANYDPTTDVQLDMDEENDWDQALEALRDRQKWKQQGADRLRAAGFTEDEIGKWEKGGEKREEDVKWTKAGEGREWDRGKTMDEEGDVEFKPEWGRLKDN